MKISAGIAMWICAVFALLCIGFALSGFLALSSITGATERELSSGYIGFWIFLGAVASVFGILSWMIKEGKFGDVD